MDGNFPTSLGDSEGTLDGRWYCPGCHIPPTGREVATSCTLAAPEPATTWDFVPSLPHHGLGTPGQCLRIFFSSRFPSAPSAWAECILDVVNHLTGWPLPWWKEVLRLVNKKDLVDYFSLAPPIQHTLPKRKGRKNERQQQNQRRQRKICRVYIWV